MTRRLARIAFPLVALLAGLATPPAAAQTPLQARLRATNTVDCLFTTHAMSDWVDGESTVEVMPIEFELGFSSVNVDEGSADAGTDFGDAFIVVNSTEDYLHFVQMFRAGPLYTTTVMAVETDDGRLLAAHTRHEYTSVALPGFTSRPEMYVGSCAIDD